MNRPQRGPVDEMDTDQVLIALDIAKTVANEEGDGDTVQHVERAIEDCKREVGGDE